MYARFELDGAVLASSEEEGNREAAEGCPPIALRESFWGIRILRFAQNDIGPSLRAFEEGVAIRPPIVYNNFALCILNFVFN